LETRKWQDQSGAEKYSTEVVLRNFRGELTLLDSRSGGGGGGASDDEMGGGYGGGGGGAPPARSGGYGGGAAKPAPARGGWDNNKKSDLDDDIPF
jgi:single-strand DNA-binding protein